MPGLFRICRNIHSPWDAAGAVRTPGRWHAQGQSVLYFSSSLALAVLEMKANGASFDALRGFYHYARIQVEFDGRNVEEAPEALYREGWSRAGDDSREFGSRWFREGRSPFLAVKSAALYAERNFVLNTLHPGFRGAAFPEPVPIPLDGRV